MRDQRRAQLRKTVRGTDKKPRLVVYRSNKFVYAQLIDDVAGKTLVAVNKATDAVVAGAELAQKALKLKIEKVVFDRAGYRYHGNIKKFADSAREKGLVF
ncbi:50S ribosomal protein L18 [Candidatus Microgenomates bacterium]|nr:50S ribosomal protein L18 [Candidatus Microgenomates bacterium]